MRVRVEEAKSEAAPVDARKPEAARAEPLPASHDAKVKAL